MMLYSALSATVVLSLVLISDGASILGIFAPAAHSHYTLGNKLMVELAKRGHNVTFISSFARKEPVKGIRDVELTGFIEDMEAMKEDIIINTKRNLIVQFSGLITMFLNQSDNVLGHPNVQKLFTKSEKFDLIIMESFMNEAFLGFGYYFKAPTVILSSVGATVWVREYARNDANPAYVPSVMGTVPCKMGFYDRVVNTIQSYTLSLLMCIHNFPTQDSIMHTYFPEAPPVMDLMHNNISIILLNSHPSYGVAKPTVPNMVEIGGYHIEEPKELPKDLKQYLDSAKEGFILFSMGSNLQSSKFTLDMRKTFMTVFSKLPYPVLWKFEDDKMDGKPANVKIHKWLPQNDILAHTNLKLFIMHGGMLSISEAVYHGVPIVGIPVFGDQNGNMVNAEVLGIGKTVEFHNLNEEKLFDAVNEVLNNQTYRDNIRHRSKLLRDQPVKPIDSAIFWIEYSLRNNYANHLKTPAIDLKWYEILLIDVFFAIVIAAAAIFAIPYLLIKKLCSGKKQKQKKLLQEKKKN